MPSEEPQQALAVNIRIRHFQQQWANVVNRRAHQSWKRLSLAQGHRASDLEMTRES